MQVIMNSVSFGSNPKKFDVFSQRIIKGVQRGQQVKLQDFTKELDSFDDCFEANKEILNKKSRALAEMLVSSNKDNLAGAVYGFLIKHNEGNVKLVESFSTNALKIAKRLNDPVQIVARADDLRGVYKVFPPENEKFIGVLYDEKRALNKIVTNYDVVKKANKNIASKEDYQLLLADVKVDIGTRHKDVKLAKQELVEARDIYAQHGLIEKVDRLNGLLNK